MAPKVNSSAISKIIAESIGKDHVEIINRLSQPKYDEDIAEAKKLIEAANRIFFLGFRYADENLQVLGFPEIISGKRVFGTVKGFTENEIGRVAKKVTSEKGIMKEIKSNVYKQNNLILEVNDCRTLLRNWL